LTLWLGVGVGQGARINKRSTYFSSGSDFPALMPDRIVTFFFMGRYLFHEGEAGLDARPNRDVLLHGLSCS